MRRFVSDCSSAQLRRKWVDERLQGHPKFTLQTQGAMRAITGNINWQAGVI